MQYTNDVVMKAIGERHLFVINKVQMVTRRLRGDQIMDNVLVTMTQAGPA